VFRLALHSISRSLGFCLFRAFARRRQVNTGPASFRKPDGDRLARGTGAMSSFPHMTDFLSNKRPGLG
jgi:hypothetical protein